MTRSVTLAAIVLLAWPAMSSEHPTDARKIPCKTEANASSCHWTRGRVQYGNGTPAIRLWKTGTHRLLGIYSGPSVNFRGDDQEDNEHPELPDNVAEHLLPLGTTIWGDFEVCPLEPERPHVMQPACIEAAKNVFVEKVN